MSGKQDLISSWLQQGRRKRKFFWAPTFLLGPPF